MITRRENLLMLLRGEKPQWVPFALNFAQWFAHHRQFGSLPGALKGCTSYVQAMKVLDCDIFTRNLDSGFRQSDTTLTPDSVVAPQSTGPRTTVTYDTPFGSLSTIRQEQTALSTSHVESYLVKDWNCDCDAFRFYLDQRAFDWDERVFESLSLEIGDAGVVNVSCGSSPLKMLHNYFGLDYASLFMMDEPVAARELCDLYWSKLWPVLERLARHPDVYSVILMDNVDTPFYPPNLADLYWVPYVKQASELLRQNGKTLFVHACGKLAGLSAQFAASGITGLEGISHPTLGDWPPADAQRCHDAFIFIGGFSAMEQQASDAEVYAFYERYLPTVERSRFIFSSSCQTAIQTPWSRITLVRDICRAWGGSPALCEAEGQTPRRVLEPK